MSAEPEIPAPKTLRELGLENYEIVTVHRSELVNAPYNPRVISDNEKAKLRAVMKRHGLVAPITWNVLTSHIVGGHQRMEILDALAGQAHYTLQVAKIDVSEAREKELNIALNNAQAMGSFENDRLKDIFADVDVSVAGAGFSQSDMMQMFGETVFDTRVADLEAFSDQLTKIAAAYYGIAAKNRTKAASEHFLVFVFRSGEQVAKFLSDNGLEDNRYQNGEDLMTKLDSNGPRTASS